MPAMPLSSLLARCAICGTVFQASVTSITQHCGPACVQLAAKRRAALMREEACCEYCGTPFPDQKRARKTGRRYCNRLCYGNARIEAVSNAWMARAEAMLAPPAYQDTATSTYPVAVASVETRTVVYDGVEFEVHWTGDTVQWGEKGGLLPPREQRNEKLLGGPDSEEEQ